MPDIEVLSVGRYGQLSGTTHVSSGADGGVTNWPHLVDPTGSPLLTDTGRWGVQGLDEGANAEHEDGRLYIFFGDVSTFLTGDPPENGDLVAWTDERSVATHGGHQAMGLDFQLPVAGAGIEGQNQWRFCLRCSGLFFDGDPAWKGACPQGGGHNTFGVGLDFSVPFEPTSVQGQPQWRFCQGCAGLFWSGDPATTGTCPAGGTHVPAGWRFVVPTTPSALAGQPNWRFCVRCHGLFWDGEASKGLCTGSPGGGIHLRAVTRDGTQTGLFDEFRGPEPIGFTGPLETPNGAFSFDHRMYVFAGISDERWSRRRREGFPAFGDYLFSKADPSKPGPWDLEFLFSPRLGWCAHDPSRSSFDSHNVLGFRFVAPHDIPPSPARMSGWRACAACQAVFFDGDPQHKGVCQRGGGPHTADPSYALDFSFDHGIAEDPQNQSNWQRCSTCQALFWANDPTDTGLCPASGRHQPTGVVVRVPHRSMDEDATHQPQWRFCHKCFALFWNGDQGNPRFVGVCPRDRGQHEAAGLNFFLEHDAVTPGAETGWRFCGRCGALFLEPAGAGGCPADAAGHQAAGWTFSLPQGSVESFDHQAGWQRCHKCQTLFFDGYDDNGRCPVDGQGHLAGAPGTGYTLLHDPGEDANNQANLRFCLRCHGLVRTDQRDAFPWVASTVVDNAEHPVLGGRTGPGVVLIGFDWLNFRLAWMPLTPGSRPRLETVRYYHAGKAAWSDVMDDSAGYELFAHRFPGQYTHVSASWLPGPRCWVVLYASAWNETKRFRSPLIARFSRDLVHWSAEVEVFDPVREGAYKAWMHEPRRVGPDGTVEEEGDLIHPHMPPPQPPGKDEPGWAYGGFVLDRYTTWDASSRILDLHYLMSTGSPYQVHLLHTALRLPDPVVAH